jgi:hypothetical protein
MIWPHGEQKLAEFLNDLNNFSILKFIHASSPHKATFLDVDIDVIDGIIQTSIHI